MPYMVSHGVRESESARRARSSIQVVGVHSKGAYTAIIIQKWGCFQI